VVIFTGGREGLIGGTSASSPAFAAILNRINEERIAAGKSTIGFVNPTLVSFKIDSKHTLELRPSQYAHPDVLHDIVKGTNAGCGTQGFSASPGWDPVTGLGTPNYPAMLSLFMSL